MNYNYSKVIFKIKKNNKDASKVKSKKSLKMYYTYKFIIT